VSGWDVPPKVIPAEGNFFSAFCEGNGLFGEVVVEKIDFLYILLPIFGIPPQYSGVAGLHN